MKRFWSLGIRILVLSAAPGVFAASPAELFAHVVRERIQPIAPDEMVRVLLELWGVFDLLKAIRITDQNGSAIARELAEPLVGVAALVHAGVPRCSVRVRQQLIAIVRELFDACELVFEHAQSEQVFFVESLLGLIERAVLSEAPAILNNA